MLVEIKPCSLSSGLSLETGKLGPILFPGITWSPFSLNCYTCSAPGCSQPHPPYTLIHLPRLTSKRRTVSELLRTKQRLPLEGPLLPCSLAASPAGRWDGKDHLCSMPIPDDLKCKRLQWAPRWKGALWYSGEQSGGQKGEQPPWEKRSGVREELGGFFCTVDG